MCSGVVRRATAAAHRRCTREVLARGRLAAAPPAGAAPLHRWAPAPAAAPARCDHCSDLLWGPLEVIYIHTYLMIYLPSLNKIRSSIDVVSDVIVSFINMNYE